MRKTVILLAVLFSCAISTGWAQYGQLTTIGFQKDKMSKGLTWSSKLLPTDEGLKQVSMSEHGHADIWIMTDKIAVPLTGNIYTRSDILLSFDKTTSVGSDYISAYVRYGCDGVHWSSWFGLEQRKEISQTGSYSKPDDTSLSFSGAIKLPQADYRHYEMLWSEWRDTKPKINTQFELCNWIKKTSPDFFNQEIPVIGYLQVLIEGVTNKAIFSEAYLSLGCTYGPVGFIDEIEGKDGHKWHFQL